MSCCGQTPAQAQAKVAAIIDEGAGVGALVRLVYVGADKRTQAFVVEGKVYQFGNNARRRVNAVPARVAPTFLAQGFAPGGHPSSAERTPRRWPGLFVVFDAQRHNEDGTQRVPGVGPEGSGIVDLVVPPVGKAKGAK